MTMNRVVFTGPLRCLSAFLCRRRLPDPGHHGSGCSVLTGYRGTIQNSNIPDITSGLQYTVNFIFDNGGTSAASQT